MPNDFVCPAKSLRPDVAEKVPGSIGVVFELKRGARGEGFFVQEVMPDGAAAANGEVASGDRLLQVDGTPIGTSSGTTFVPMIINDLYWYTFL